MRISNEKRWRRNLPTAALVAVFTGAALMGVVFLAEKKISSQPVLAELPAPSATRLFLIDAGHGGEDGGTKGFGAQEKDLALQVALQLAQELRGRGFDVAHTRETDVAVSLDERVEMANRLRPTALLSIHFNYSAQAPAATGIEVYYSARKEFSAQSAPAVVLAQPALSSCADSRALAASVLKSSSVAADTPARALREREGLAVLRRTACPAILIECGYLSHKSDAFRAPQERWQKQLARGIAEGVEVWATTARDGVVAGSPR